MRLEEAVTLRDFYGRKYNWAKQMKELVDRMICLTYGRNVNYILFSGALSGNNRRKNEKHANGIAYKFCPEVLIKMFTMPI